MGELLLTTGEQGFMKVELHGCHVTRRARPAQTLCNDCLPSSSSPYMLGCWLYHRNGVSSGCTLLVLCLVFLARGEGVARTSLVQGLLFCRHQLSRICRYGLASIVCCVF